MTSLSVIGQNNQKATIIPRFWEDRTLVAVPEPVECTANNFTSRNNCMSDVLERKARPLCGSLVGLCYTNYKQLVCGAG